MQDTDTLTQGPVAMRECRLPRGQFEWPDAAYAEAAIALLPLKQAPPEMQIPDLKTHLIYYGKNGRPDADVERTQLHFSLNGSKEVASIYPGDRLYLLHERKNGMGRYIFSPENAKTSLWIEPMPIGQEAQIQVTLENDRGERIEEPEAHQQFRLPEKEFVRHIGNQWEIGGGRVDGTLLVRQKARWFGQDRFLEHHGGEEYAHCIGRQRIDFGENDALYSVFVQVGDCLRWEENRWQVVSPGADSMGRPLLVVKKIEDRLMMFELWDVEGKGKVVLNLLRSVEGWPMQNGQGVQQLFKFLGAKTKSQCVFEVNRERMVLRPSDWLLCTPKGWKRIATSDEVDQYLSRKWLGTLFVFEGIGRQDERQVMKGTLYSPARHEHYSVCLPLQPKETTPATGVGRDAKEDALKK